MVFLLVAGCGFGNHDDVRLHADDVWKQSGFKPITYLGYSVGPVIPFTPYGGAYVWYRLEKTPDNGIIYKGALQRWGNEYHVYRLCAIDAIRPRQ